MRRNNYDVRTGKAMLYSLDIDLIESHIHDRTCRKCKKNTIYYPDKKVNNTGSKTYVIDLKFGF